MSVDAEAKLLAVVVDDEPLARSNLTALLRAHTDIRVVDECGDGFAAIESIRRWKPGVVFLDVEMPQCDGFDVVEMLGPEIPPAVVFVTAYDRYALRAFDAGAIDYLLKPFDSLRFERTLARARDRVRERSAGRPRASLAIKSAGGMTFVSISDIDWIEAADYYSRLHVGAKSYLLRRSMAELETELAALFARIHRSAIVQLDRVRSLEPSETGEYDVLLRDGTRLPASRRYRKHLESLMTTRDARGR